MATASGATFNLLKAEALTPITDALTAATAADAATANLAALAAGAPLFASLADGEAATASGDVFMVSTTPGVAVYENSSGSGSFLGWLGELLFGNAAELIASTLTGYSTGQAIRTREDGFSYIVAASGATDHHVTTAGGVKLYVKPGASGRYNIKAFGAKGDGTTDDSAAIQSAVDLGKSSTGITIFFPRGAWRVETSIDCTYAGVAASIGSGYYGFTVEGSDQINSYIMGRTAGTPTWDCTGKSRMTFRNIGFANYTDGVHNPSCLMLLARNTTNGYAGGHVFDRCNFRGFCTQTGLQCASSEVNRFINVDFETYRAGASGLELTEQIETTVNSEYIDLSSHTFSGGNTRHIFVGCAFNGSSVASGTHYVRCSGIDNSMFLACYAHFGSGEAAFQFSGDCSNVSFLDVRGEGEGDYFIRLASGVVVTGLTVTGRSSSPIRGEDTSAFVGCRIDPSFLATGSGATSFSFDAYDALDCDFYTLTNGGRVRNSARGTRFWGFNGTGAWSLPTGDLTQPEFYGLSYSGGSANYRRRIHTKSKWERRGFGRQEIGTLVLTTENVTNLSAANYASGYTPDMDVATSFNFTVIGNATVNAPVNADLAPGDPKGQMLILTFSQDATGGHTVTLPSNYDLQGASIPTTAFARVSMMFIFLSTTGGGKWMRIN